MPRLPQTRVDVIVGYGVASCREQLGLGTPLGQADTLSLGLTGLAPFSGLIILLLRLHRPWTLERWCLVGLHTWPALLCVEMAWVRSGASLRKLLAGTEFFPVRILLMSVYILICSGLAASGHLLLRHEPSVSGGSSRLHALVLTHLASL